MTLEQYEEIFYTVKGGRGEGPVSLYDGRLLYIINPASQALQVVEPVTVDHAYLIHRGERCGLVVFELDNENVIATADWFRIQGLISQEKYDIIEAAVKFNEAYSKFAGTREKQVEIPTISLPDGTPIH